MYDSNTHKLWIQSFLLKSLICLCKASESPQHSKDFHYLLAYLGSLKLPGSPFFAILSDTTPLPFYHLYEDGKDFSQFDYFVMMRVSLCQSHFYAVVLSTFLS